MYKEETKGKKRKQQWKLRRTNGQVGVKGRWCGISDNVARNFIKDRMVNNFVKCCYGKREMATRCSNVKIIGDFDERSFSAMLGD